jgi:hypothetical protein
MKYRPENYEALIAYRMKQWLQLAIGAVDKYDRSRAIPEHLASLPAARPFVADSSGRAPRGADGVIEVSGIHRHH